ncbi:MAG: response regulator [Bacteroidales bacterium]|nr:response regulator [Bacteroidales bacterium]
MKKISFLSLILLWLTIGCLRTQPLRSQDEAIDFIKIDELEAFNNTSIVCIFQDREGFMWFGTYGGLYRYDGKNYREFQPVRDNPKSLINGHIRSICQDTAGNIFIGTIGGLCVFNPLTEEFHRFEHNPADSNSLANNTVYKVFTDQSGTIWAGTWGGGLDRIEKIATPENEAYGLRLRFIHHVHSNSDPQSICSNNIADIAGTPDGRIWLGTQDGLSCYHPASNTFINYFHDPKDPYSISNNNVSSLCIDQNGQIWAGTWEFGLNIFDPRENKAFRFVHNPDNKNSLSHNIIMRLYCDKSGTIWVGTWGGGLDRVTLSGKNTGSGAANNTKSKWVFTHFKQQKSNPFSISGNSIYSILQDNTGTYWIGTDWNGLNKFTMLKSPFRQIKSIPGQQNSLADNVVFSMLIDRDGMLWIGTQNGLNIFNRETGEYKLYQHNPADKHSLSHNEVRSIIEDHKGNIWIGTIQGLNRFDPAKKRFERFLISHERPSLTHIIEVFEDSEGYLWLGTYEQGLLRFDPGTGLFTQYKHENGDPASLSSDIVWAIAEDPHQNLWIGTENGGLCTFNRTGKTFTTYRHNTRDSASVGYNTIYSIASDSSGNLWMGTPAGLSTLLADKAGKATFRNYRLGVMVSGITKGLQNIFWLLTDEGLGRFNPETDKAAAYFRIGSGGLNQRFSINAIQYDTVSDEVYAGGLDGYYVFDPHNAGEMSVPPVTRIVNLRIFNQNVRTGEKVNGRVILPQSITTLNKLTFSHREYVISLEYAALHYQRPEHNQYAYKLESFDKDWNYVGNQQFATYTNLPPGNYRFMVKAANPSGVWNDQPTTITLVIRPAWWDTVLFKLLIVFLFIAAIVSFFLIRLKLMKERQNMLEQMVAIRTTELSGANQLLTEKQGEITLQNEELLKHRNELESLVAERTKELTIAKNKAEESDRLKSAFLANMSHEIRTPMNAIVGFSGLLEDDNLTAEEKGAYVRTIQHNSDTLLTLINDILDISIIEANQLVLYNSEFCVDELLIELKNFYNLNNEKGLTIDFINESNRLNAFLYNDPIRVRQVMMNLLTNAYKFTEKGSVLFGYTLDPPAGTIRFFVSDTGVGIPENDRKKIFEDFYKIEQKGKRFHQGTGIGLSICKKLVGLMGGSIGVDSVPGQGSTFYFTLPYTEDQPDAPTENFYSSMPPDLNNITIVVAEDEDDNYRLMEKLLTKRGAVIFWARNGREAVNYIRENGSKNHCLILMDIKMPVMNGMEACALIKQMNPEIPVIAVTAFAQESDKVKILQNNFDGFISKPLKSEALWASISTSIARYYS